MENRCSEAAAGIIMIELSLRTLHGVPVVLNADHTAYFHIPSFLPRLIDEAATLINAEFTELIRDEPITWPPIPANARLAAAPIADALNIE